MTTAITPMLASLPSLRAVVDRYGIWPEKKWGQNFLFDLQLTDKIARAAGDLSQSTVLEIGAGPGGLTRALLKAGAKKVVAVEQDRRCLQALRDIAMCTPGRLDIIEGDALAVEEEALVTKPAIIVSNLPYNIATPLLFKWLDGAPLFTQLTLMFQKEVADRIMAAPGSKTFGRLSVMTQWQCTVVKHFDISPKAFMPPPKVTSSVITLTPRSAPLAPADKPTLEKLCKAIFGQRRKTLRVSLKQLVHTPLVLLANANIEENKRPEELSIEMLCALAGALYAHTSNQK